VSTEHPITPPNELAQQWYRDAEHQLAPYYVFVARCAAQWGADQELEGCIDVLGGQWESDVLTQCTGWKEFRYHSEEILRNARRPKPPSLAKRALHILGTHGDLSCAEHDTIRCALEALDD
jgi:hypothetical protein